MFTTAFSQRISCSGSSVEFTKTGLDWVAGCTLCTLRLKVEESVLRRQQMINWPRTRRWLLESALPLWATTGFDEAHSSFVERLTFTGLPINNVPRRLMVQARQIYSFALAEQYSWFLGAHRLVKVATESMISAYYQADGKPGWVTSVDADGVVLDSRRDLYAHAFVLLGLASAFRVTADQRYLQLAEATLQFLDAHMSYTYGGYVSVLPAAATVLAQNPHMHLLESLLLLYRVAPKTDYQRRAESIVELFETTLFQPASGTLTERFGAKWEPCDKNSSLFEPGHHYEWAWLLQQYSTLFNQPLSVKAASLSQNAAAFGCSQDGLLWSEVTSNGDVVDASFRLWPHTEALKAALIEGQVQSSDRLLAIINHHFLLNTHPGCWRDRIDVKDQLLVDFVPASSLYHLVCAFGEVERLTSLTLLPHV